MKLNVFRCRDGYLLTEAAASEPDAAHLDYVGEFLSSRLAPHVRARVAREIEDRNYALIGQDELMLE